MEFVETQHGHIVTSYICGRDGEMVECKRLNLDQPIMLTERTGRVFKTTVKEALALQYPLEDASGIADRNKTMVQLGFPPDMEPLKPTEE